MRAALSSYTLEDQERMARAANYFAWQHRVVARELGRRVIEIGCGIGNFTGLLLNACEAVAAVDVEAGCIDRLRGRYPGQANLEAFACDVMAPKFFGLQSFRADSCVCLNVLEHIEDDREALRPRCSLDAPRRGVVVLIVPAFPSLYGPIDELLGHYRRYTRASISKLAEAAGLAVKTARYMNAIGFFAWWTNAHILKRACSVGGADRSIRPVRSSRPPRALEGWMYPPFGQSLLIVLKKPV